MARYSLNFDRLSPIAQEAPRATAAGIRSVAIHSSSIIVRAVEVLWACDEALRIIGSYEPPDVPAVEVTPRAGVGFGVTEAPRGVLYHRYRIDEDGNILDAKIVPPTSQNQKTIENDLRHYVAPRIDLPNDQLRWQCEQAVRNYDPCISCATHFLKLQIIRE